MASEASAQQKNQESSIHFMQQEHTATLKALHEEIQKLQSKCTDLTFQLTMNGVSVDEEGDADSRLREVSDKLKASQSQKTSLDSQLAEQNRKLQQLEQELRTQKKHQLDEMRKAEQTVSSLKAEAEAKVNNIAYLTSEFHRLKLKPSTSSLGSMEESSGAKVRQHPQPQYPHLPTPPRDLLTNSARTRQRRSHAMSRPGGRHVRALTSAAGVQPARVGSASDTPDISPFVQRDLNVSVSAVEVKKPAPLPPITGSRLGVKEREIHRVVISKRGQLTRAALPEVATLAVDQIGDVNWKKLPQSHSCENQ